MVAEKLVYKKKVRLSSSAASHSFARSVQMVQLSQFSLGPDISVCIQIGERDCVLGSG